MVSYQREIPVKHRIDVCVVGGGPAGVTAAVAAARQGKRVLLVEALGALGGLGTVGMVPAYMQFGDGETFFAAGLGKEIFDQLCAMGGALDIGKDGGCAIVVEKLKRLYDQMVTEAGVQTLLMTQLVDVQATDGHVEALIFSGRQGLWAAQAHTYVDTTGDGNLAVWAGAQYELGQNGVTMPSTLCSLWTGIDWDRVIRPESRMLEKAFADGVFTVEDRHLSGMWRVGAHEGGLNGGHEWNVDGTSEEDLTRALMHSRVQLLEYERYLREYLDGYEKATLLYSADIMGIRETRRILGHYVLSEQDYHKRAVFEDEIGRYCYNIDIHPMDNSPEALAEFKRKHEGLRYKKGESYGLPYRSLVPRGLDNVLVAGRCISCDRVMQSCIRVMPGCYITGQAAGVAAAQCAERDVSPLEADTASIQKALLSMGMLLPNS